MGPSCYIEYPGIRNRTIKGFYCISGMVGPIDVKRKGGASVGYWVNYVTLTFDLTHDLDL